MNTPLRRLSVVVAVLFALLLGSATWVQFAQAGALRDDPRNSRTLLAELGRDRGAITAADGSVLAESVEAEGPIAYRRTYPEGALYGHPVGSYSVVYGATGVEDALGGLLAGTSDQLFYRRLADLVTGAQPAGANVELTLRPEVQQAAADALGDQRGAVVALEPSTGRVLALVSSPGYDPNLLSSLDTEAVRSSYAELLEAPGNPLRPNATAETYPPGSVFKLVTAAAALETGGYTPDSVLPGPAVLDLPLTDVGLPNVTGDACGADDLVSLADALRISCNTAFGALGLELPEDAVADTAADFGFGRSLEIPVDVVASSYPEDPDQPQRALAAIGQFDVRVTPLQVAMVSAGIANGGVVMQPQLVGQVRAQDLSLVDAPEPRELGRAVSAGTAASLTEMMQLVVTDGTGTSAAIDGVAVAGKSGTAEVGDTDGDGEPEDPHAWFTAFAPADDPQVAVAVVVENGGDAGSEASGGRTAAPVARQVMEAVVGR
ncbi:peptidoglycan D,D-transpeptidase FtsI family protein [Pseudokineococcus lusitanus]|uniref:Cell elongation-specific peptidoglycan D,D-transpeptidase n=1 Tax=Pseudokineococcus lusitanus TaxID=763993 RepID=A0A3N1GWN8_9ACTN|nr:penicillin-binding protein 2 [Pseudokineococcus lusitanus]ROP34683.1 cell elongation-specific peptidoglycan D,D-transpeptidase [Pseudokineococcus lusitanus]